MKNMKFSAENAHHKITLKEKKKFNFLNMHSLYLFNKNSKFREAVSFRHAINFPDGAMIARKLRIRKQRGPDFTREFLMNDFAKKKKHFFIGLENYETDKLSKITGIAKSKIKGYNPSFISGIEFLAEEREKIIEEVNKSKSDYLWICVGNPKQEILGYQLFESVDVDKIFNVGAALDFLLGREKESPKIWQKMGLEWVYLGITNPKRTLKKIRMSFVALKYLRRIQKK
jgi:exopolysaccharide biosynthesis WecB/TagA/CpsF family protein